LDLNFKEELSAMEKYLAQRLGVNGLCDGVYSIESSFVVGQRTDPITASATSVECGNACWKTIERAMGIAIAQADFPEPEPTMVVMPTDLARDYFVRFVRDEVYAIMSNQAPYADILPADGSTDDCVDVRVNIGIYWINKSRWIRMSVHRTNKKPVYPRIREWFLIRETDNIMF
jgi:hypothetical protein